MEEKGERKTFGELLVSYSGIIIIGISFITFLVLFQNSIAQISNILLLSSEITGFQGFSLSSSLIYLVLIATLILSGTAIASLVYHRNDVSMGFRDKENRKYFNYLTVYILIQLILSEIIAYFFPNYGTQFPFNESAGIQNFVFSYLSLVEAVLYQLIPLTVAVIIVSAYHGKLGLKALRFYDLNQIEILLISVFMAMVSTVLVSGSVLDYITDFISFFVLNEIFLRFGFLRALLTNFTIAMTNVTATLISGNVILSTILPIFLFFLGFLGIYSLVQIGISAPRGLPADVESKETPQPRRARPALLIEPFIRSRCPDCGNAIYHIIMPGMSLKCSKCGRELEKNATGEANIKIEVGSPSRY